MILTQGKNRVGVHVCVFVLALFAPLRPNEIKRYDLKNTKPNKKRALNHTPFWAIFCARITLISYQTHTLLDGSPPHDYRTHPRAKDPSFNSRFLPRFASFILRPPDQHNIIINQPSRPQSTAFVKAIRTETRGSHELTKPETMLFETQYNTVHSGRTANVAAVVQFKTGVRCQQSQHPYPCRTSSHHHSC